VLHPGHETVGGHGPQHRVVSVHAGSGRFVGQPEASNPATESQISLSSFPENGNCGKNTPLRAGQQLTEIGTFKNLMCNDKTTLPKPTYSCVSGT
jgi:hypothetical protein